MIGRIAVLAGLVVTLSGCSLFRSSPVPPPPPPPKADVVGTVDGRPLSEQVLRDGEGEVTGFASLRQARETVDEAASDAAVAEHAPEALERARAALADAESTWQEVARAPARGRNELAAVAHDSHRARRWAEIAMAEAARQRDLAELTRVRRKQARREAEDERWLGTELVPGRYGDIRFAAGTARITPGSRRVIEELVEFLEIHPRYALEIAGHTDDSPPSPRNLQRFLEKHPDIAEQAGDAQARAAAYNKAMSQRRAEAVADALENAGIDRSRLSTKGYGASQPVADNDTPEGRRQNRRVEVTVIPAVGWAGN